ncbi:MAG: hypothetical protein ACQR33_06060 [Candidatus Saccharibacteria bacterium]
MSKTPLMSRTSHKPNVDEDFVGSITVVPGQTSSLIVGIFEDGIPEPDLALEIEPQNCSITSKLERARERGEYHLIYHFRSLQNIPCQITVRQQATA